MCTKIDDDWIPLGLLERERKKETKRKEMERH